MELYSQTAQDSSGDIVNGSSVTVTIASSGANATLYDKDGDALSNPFLTGYDRSKGEVEFQADNGLYNITVTGNPGATKANQALFDPTSAESPIWSGNGIYNGKLTVNQKALVLDAAASTLVNGTYHIDMRDGSLTTVTGTIQWRSTSPAPDNTRSLRYTATSTATGSIGDLYHVEDFSSVKPEKLC